MQELKITMLGPRGVGKTTLLTAMYEQFEENIGKINLQLTPDEESSAILQERLIELKSLVDSPECMGGIQGTEGDPDDLRSFIFGLGQKGKKPSLQLRFLDYPGGYHGAKATPEKREFVKKLLTECVAVIIAIDTPALMEGKGKWHDTINKPQQITDLFKRYYSDLKSPRLVIFAPVKCEKYIQNEKSSKELSQRLENGYENLFNLFKTGSLAANIVTVITPVQTVGGVLFSIIETDNNIPKFKFEKAKFDTVYCPKDSEQLLRYLLRFLLSLHITELREQSVNAFKSNFFGFLISWLVDDIYLQSVVAIIRDQFGLDEHLKQAVREFASDCKKSDGFKVIQGQKWLNIE